MEFTKFEPIPIKGSAVLGERWVRETIRDDPSLLGLGDVIVKDWERTQPRAGRLDVLLQDTESAQRYEVEIQLGATDESHIIRVIEYWDIERKRYPQYEHAAVLVAEDITSRFLNVISLLNGTIPLIAIQMKAYRAGSKVGLVFTKVVDVLSRGFVDEDEEIAEQADREYWVSRASKKTMEMADEVFAAAQMVVPGIEMNYTKHHIGVLRGGRAFNFLTLRPKKAFLRLDIRLQPSQELQERLESLGLDVMDSGNRPGRLRLRLQPGTLEKNRAVIAELIRDAYAQTSKE